jgi:hypothetical protein
MIVEKLGINLAGVRSAIHLIDSKFVYGYVDHVDKCVANDIMYSNPRFERRSGGLTTIVEVVRTDSVLDFTSSPFLS